MAVGFGGADDISTAGGSQGDSVPAVLTLIGIHRRLSALPASRVLDYAQGTIASSSSAVRQTIGFGRCVMRHRMTITTEPQLPRVCSKVAGAELEAFTGRAV